MKMEVSNSSSATSASLLSSHVTSHHDNLSDYHNHHHHSSHLPPPPSATPLTSSDGYTLAPVSSASPPPSMSSMAVLSGNGGMLPSLSALDKYSSDHLMSSLGFSHYTTIGVRKLPEGNNHQESGHQHSLSPIPSYSSLVTSPSPVTTILAPVTTHQTYSTTQAPSSSYPYFSSSQSVDLSSPLYGSYSTTGVFSSKTLQPSRPRSKARANTGKAKLAFFNNSAQLTTSGSRHSSLISTNKTYFLIPQSYIFEKLFYSSSLHWDCFGFI